MNKKILIFLMIILSLTINNVNAEIYEGEMISDVFIDTDSTGGHVTTCTISVDALFIKNADAVKGIQSVFITIPETTWAGSSTTTYGKSDVTYKQDDIIVGEGYMYFWQQNTDSIPGFDYVYIKCYFESGLNISGGAQYVDIEGDILSSILYKKFEAYTPGYTSFPTKGVLIGNEASGQINCITGTHTSRVEKSNYNKYYYWYDEENELLQFNMSRDGVNTSQLLISNANTVLLNETSQKSTDSLVISDDIDNSTWSLYALDGNNQAFTRTLNFIPEIETITPTLTTDKLLYNTSEQITISFTNIDEIEEYFTRSDTLSIYILYSVIEDYADYRAKYAMVLHPDRRDEIFTINTSILLPQNEYHLAICDDGEYHRIEDALIISDTFFVYTDAEYINTNCNPEGNCYTSNNNDITIFYRVNNNSDIIIKDNNNDIIQTYYNIIGQGEINYHIPDDLNKLNSYPNWKIYLNNTEYSTSYSTNVIIYWSLFTTPIPTPVYTVDIPDENVTEQIEQLKEESKPIFDLIYGLTTLVVDNPDYDNDNIVDEHEINNWFNSLIPLGILLLLIILYMGLKKRD